MTTYEESDYGHTTFHSDDTPLVEFDDRDRSATALTADDIPRNAEYFLVWMRLRLAVYGTPLPDNFVPPPGIDIAAILRQVPWPPTE